MTESICPPLSTVTNTTMTTTIPMEMTTTNRTTISTSTLTSSVCEPFKQVPSESIKCTKPKWSQQGIIIAGTGAAGSSPMQLKYPMGIFIDQNDNDALYVADRDNYRIQKFAQGSNGVGVTVAGGNGDGRADNQISGVYDIFVDSARNIFIADRQGHRVQRWAENSSIGVTLVDLENDYLPYGVWFNEKTGDLYVTEATVYVGSGRLTKYSMMNRTVVNRTIIAPHLELARGLFIDQCNSDVYVADTYAKTINKFSTSGNHEDGSVVFSGFETPEDVISDCYGNLYVAESDVWYKDLPPVRRINMREGGKREAVIGPKSKNAPRLPTPYSMAFDSQWNLYIADSVNATVQKFLFEGGDLYC
ncbi:hypothetical protein I4U23_017193 [Adineta vaga]|nr:hypothetical protein I4U23_017193 [Adineta vaga]